METEETPNWWPAYLQRVNAAMDAAGLRVDDQETATGPATSRYSILPELQRALAEARERRVRGPRCSCCRQPIDDPIGNTGRRYFCDPCSTRMDLERSPLEGQS